MKDDLTKHQERVKRWPMERIWEKMELLKSLRNDVILSVERSDDWLKQAVRLDRIYDVYFNRWHAQTQANRTAEKKRQYSERWSQRN